jgi:hypothetical protein
VTRAGWSVAIRRIAETICAIIPVIAALAAPIIVSVITQKGDLYPWAQQVHAGASHVEHEAKAESTDVEDHAGGIRPLDELTIEKRPYLNPAFFLARVFIYFAIWAGFGIWYWRKSVEQDATHDGTLSLKMQALSAPALVIYGLTVTFAAFDLVMSLDPRWYSTMFGIYLFSGSAVAIFATLIIAAQVLQRNGYLTQSITTEHFHDLGKFLFAFTFFWGYIAFSQYMLLWYANIPEETEWFIRHGATSVDPDKNGWTYFLIILLFGHLLIPFIGLLSRHVKRNQKTLLFWAIWMLVFHWLDLLWLIMPELNDGKFYLGIVELLCFVGIGGICLAAVLRIALRHSLRPLADPRLTESLAFQNI